VSRRLLSYAGFLSFGTCPRERDLPGESSLLMIDDVHHGSGAEPSRSGASPRGKTKAGDGGASGGLAVAGWTASPHWGVYAALLLTSAALLTLEIALTRFFSHTIWYHFAYLTISMALLGFGATGSLISAFSGFFARRGQRFVVAALVAAGLLTTAGLVFLARFPLEIENLLKKPLRFSLSLLVYYLVVGAPFLLAGFAVSAPFAAWPQRMGRLYAWDLVGAALGCAFVVWGIEPFGVPGLILSAAGLMVLAAAALVAGGGARGPGAALGAFGVLVLVLAAPVGGAIPVAVTSSKSLPQLLAVDTGAPPFEQRADTFSKWTAINRVDAFGWDYPSPHSYWSRVGLSNTWKGTVPPVARLTYDGGNGSDVYGHKGDVQEEFRFLEHHLLRVPYLMLDRPNVLAIGIGGGIDLFNAVKQGARHVTGAELQPETVRLQKETLRAFNSGFFLRDDVTLLASEGRHFVRKTNEVFDLVQITAVDTFAAQAAGAYVLAESYLYTVEAMQDYFRRLADDGMVVTVMGDMGSMEQLPPLASRLALIGHRALSEWGVADPSRHLLLVGSVVTGSIYVDEMVLVKKTPFTDAEIARVRAYAGENGFHVLYAPGDVLQPLAKLLTGDEAARRAMIDAEPFDIEATRDNDPFFYNIGKWSRFSAGSGIYFVMPGSFMGQLVLLLMVLQSTLLGAVLVVAPLLLHARDGLKVRGVASYLAYFLALGVGFMFIEISFVQTFVLFLGSPTYALSVTIFSLLLFSGLGSLATTRFSAAPEKVLARLAPAIAALVVVYALGLSRVFDAALHLDLPLRIAIAVFAQMPIGLVLGMFMPLGIACVAREDARLVPWAWGVNGVGSVTGTTLAVLLAMASGFFTVALVAAALYLAGTALLLRAGRTTRG
jgi:hypothetical protein